MNLYDINGNVISVGGNGNTVLPLAGKNVLFIGDSLTFGNMGTDPETGGQLYPQKNYPQYFAEKTGCNVYNKGRSGANAISYRDYVYSEIDFAVDYAAAIIMLGTNLGLADVYGEAYAEIIEQLAADTGGKTRIFLVTPPYNNHSTAVFNYAKNSNAVVKQMGETYCLPVIDAYYESGVNQFGGELCRPVDDLHFNDEGYRRLGYFISNQVMAHGWW